MAQATPKNNGTISDINVTPLVDVVLVLLVILMTTASYIVSKSIPVELPEGATGEASPSRALAITVDASGALYLDAKPTDATALRASVRSAVSADRGARAVIAADGRTPHRHVVQVIDLLRREGLTRFAINVRPEELSSTP